MARSILEIMIAANDAQPATDEELRLALVAVANLLYSVERSERDLVEAVLADKPSAHMRAQFAKCEAERRFSAKKLEPTAFLGREHTPGTPENLRLRTMAANVFKAATGQDL